jgi:rare lipoprotein A
MHDQKPSRLWGFAGLLALLVVALLFVAWPPDDLSANGQQGRQKAQVGLASFYGPGFHGNRTASGARFDQRKMTAAHRTLPLGTRVRVTNLENGESVVLLINDRGPYGRNYRKGTIIDVSKGAASRLEFIPDGLVRVRVEVLDEADDGSRGSQ